MVLSFDEALEAVRLQASGAGLRSRVVQEQVQLLEARGRVLAGAVKAERDQPPFDRATRDGFAVRAEDLGAAAAEGLQVLGEVRAGERWAGAAVGRGEAVGIMTGAPMPEGADAVVMVEHVREADGRVWVDGGRSLRAGENVVRRGAEARAGEVVVPERVEMGAAEIALAAACGAGEISVYRRPKVAIVATGDELVELGEVPEAWQIRNSNSYGLAALVEAAGGEAVRLPIARDTSEDLRERLHEAMRCDLVLLSGGVSMGKYDLVEEVLGEFGAEFLFTGVRMQPGKPVVFGRIPERSSGDGGERYFFGLPGNPVSTQVTFHCFAEPMVRAMSGREAEGPRFAQATLGQDVEGKAGLMRVLPARLTSKRVGPEVRLVGWQGSGDMAANARANCYAVLPGDVDRFRTGDVVTVLLR